MPFGIGKKKESVAVKDAAPQPGHERYGQQAQQQQQYGQPAPQYAQPQYKPTTGPAVYHAQPQYQPTVQAHQQAPQQQQQQPQQAVMGTPAKEGETTQQVGGHPEPVVGTPIYSDDNCKDPTVKKKFITQGWKDVWALVVFLVQILITIIWAIYNSGSVAILDWGGDTTTTTAISSNNSTSSETVTEHPKSQLFFFSSFLISILLACVMMVVMRLKPVQYIWGANIVCICLYILLAIWYVSCCSAFISALFLLISAAFHAFCLYTSRHRIPFVASLMKQSLATTHKNFGTYVCSFATLVVLILYVSLFSLMVIPTLQDVSQLNDDGSGPPGGSTFLLLIFLLMLFWTIQVELNIVHTTTCGSVATWFYAGDANMPPMPTVASAKRAMSTSLGSICFGSLLVAILQVIRVVVTSLMSRCGPAFACVANCILGLLERLLRYFNEYAFCYVAIYGMGYVDGAKATFDIIKTSLWSGLFNDWITGVALYITALLDSLLIGMMFWVASDSFVLGIACFVVSWAVHLLLFRVVSSGITTMFVCITEDEAVLRQSNPVFYAELNAARAGINPSGQSQA